MIDLNRKKKSSEPENEMGRMIAILMPILTAMLFLMERTL